MKKILLVVTFFSFYVQFVFGQIEPAAQPTNIDFLGLKAYGLTMRFDASDATKYLVLRSTEDITAVPVDNTEYLVGEHLGNAKVFFTGNKKSLYQFRESIANTTYHFAVFAYNESGSNYNYKTDNPLKGSQTTLGKDIGNYYDNYRIDTEDAIDDLTDLLKNHSDLSYGDYDDGLVDNLLERDTAVIDNGSLVSRKYVVCEYSNIVDVYVNDNNYDFNIFNREHVIPRSWMPSTPSSNNDDQNETTDYYNLYLVKASVNQTLRSAYVFDEVVTVNNVESDCKNGANIDGVTAFEPKESAKGDIARTLFYQIVAYDGVSGSWAFDNLLSNGSVQDVDLLLQWHAQDPPDNFEIARNELIYNLQGNRNPFIDNPDWVKCIDFKTLTLTGTCPLDTAYVDPTLAINDLSNSQNVLIYPNPIKSNGFVKLLDTEEIQQIELMTINGGNMAIEYSLDGQIANFKVGDIANGIYFMKISTSEKVMVKKIQILKN